MRSIIESPTQTVFPGLATQPFNAIPSRLRSDSAGIFVSRDRGHFASLCGISSDARC
ncbi:MAG: hypothetical protein JXA28_13165 [Bacteroidetes bacterium]|nr:hypothetical protein [Bacteroidota bacterium]